MKRLILNGAVVAETTEQLLLQLLTNPITHEPVVYH